MQRRQKAGLCRARAVVTRMRKKLRKSMMCWPLEEFTLQVRSAGDGQRSPMGSSPQKSGAWRGGRRLEMYSCTSKTASSDTPHDSFHMLRWDSEAFRGGETSNEDIAGFMTVIIGKYTETSE